ncbi:unnamed protein product [Mesocestoides corti]|uniref:tetrahydrofolate synthase n=1 Tax=Mesocestoides corti TaxID=53468 RepID=A0A0R3UHD3_MESCO|nr:unnamed protein product [Mesocestoides corti]
MQIQRTYLKASGLTDMFRGIRAPGYLSFIITLAYHIFLAEKVDVAVVEVGLGGRYDHTNVVQHPRVVAVSSIELEHKDKLGSTIREVAWNKAGIFKVWLISIIATTFSPAVPGVVATNQPDDAMQVFVEEARSVGVSATITVSPSLLSLPIPCPLFVAPRFVDIWQEIERDGGAEVSQRFADLVREKGVPPVTERNICLALAAFKLWHDQAPEVAPLPAFCVTRIGSIPGSRKTDAFSRISFPAGILSARVVGRFQVVQVTKSVTFFLDCAHTTDSIKHCSNWFNTASEMATSTPRTQIIRILLFTVTGTRDPGPMLELLQVHNFDAVHFSGFKGSNLVRNFGKTPNAAACKASWDRLGTSTPASELTDAEVVPFIRTLKGWDGESRLKLNCGAARPKAIQVLVTGSVYLVGDVLSSFLSWFGQLGRRNIPLPGQSAAPAGVITASHHTRTHTRVDNRSPITALSTQTRLVRNS